MPLEHEGDPLDLMFVKTVCSSYLLCAQVLWEMGPQAFVLHGAVLLSISLISWTRAMSNEWQGAEKNRYSKSLHQERSIINSFWPHLSCGEALLVDRGPEASSILVPACNCALHLIKMFRYRSFRCMCALQVTFSGFKITAPRHSWSADALSIISHSAIITTKEGAMEAALMKPEIFWSTSASASCEASAQKVSQRRIWHGGDLEVDIDTKLCQIEASYHLPYSKFQPTALCVYVLHSLGTT